jgi:hypothetical protein
MGPENCGKFSTQPRHPAPLPPNNPADFFARPYLLPHKFGIHLFSTTISHPKPLVAL